MSVADELHVVCPPGAGRPDCVADMIAAFYHTLYSAAGQQSKKTRRFLSTMVTVARRCAAALGQTPEKATLEAVCANEEKLLTHFTKLKLEPNYKSRHLEYKNKMLHYAHELGWNSPSYERQLACHQGWLPIRDALYGDSEGCLTMVNLAEKRRKMPSEIDEGFLVEWRQSRPSCSAATIREVEGRFRTKMRQAGLESLFPLLDLTNRLPTEYAINYDTAPRTLIDDIEAAVHYKTDEIVRGRPAKERVKPVTGIGIRTALKEVCGIAIKNFEGITRLKDVYREEVFEKVIQVLRDERGLPGGGIRCRLGNISFVTRTNLVVEGEDYSWFRRKLNALGNEPRWRLDERQNAKCIAYEELAEVPRKIRSYRMLTHNLSPVEKARLIHDELMTTWPLHLPWRFCSIADCGLFAPAFTNIIDAELPLAMQTDPDLPGWVRKALKKNKHARFLQFNFGKSQCKNNHPVRDIVPRELVPLYREYRKCRGLLVDPDNDDGTLFLNRRGRRLSSSTCRKRFAQIVETWIGRHARPHLTRDSFCEFRLAHGDSMRMLQRKLWHRYIISTEGYCRRYDAAHGAMVLDRRLAKQRDLRKAA